MGNPAFRIQVENRALILMNPKSPYYRPEILFFMEDLITATV